MTNELQEVLAVHQKWLRGESVGSRADLRGADLSGADLSGADLSRANLRGANLSRADLSGANLSDADLSRADLSRADLLRANLRGANLSRANLRGADLSGANLSGADLRGADLSRADLSGANLSDANLSRANLSGADLRGADLSRADLPPHLIAPEEGEFVGWKKLANGRVVRIQIPADSARVNAIGSRKCRAEYVIPLDDCGQDGNEGPNKGGLKYVKGEISRCDSWDPDIRIECSGGVHFFITRREAEEWK